MTCNCGKSVIGQRNTYYVECLQDEDSVQFFAHNRFVGNELVGTTYYTFEGEVYNPQGDIGPCDSNVSLENCCSDSEMLLLSDENGPFIRQILFNNDGDVVEVNDYDLDGNPYVAVGNIDPSETGNNDAESIALCDDNGSFLRQYIYDETGTIQATFNTQLDGVTPYIPVGTVDLCANKNHEETIDAIDDLNLGQNVVFFREVLVGNQTWQLSNHAPVAELRVWVQNIFNINSPATLTDNNLMLGEQLYEGEEFSVGANGDMITGDMIITVQPGDVVIVYYTKVVP